MPVWNIFVLYRLNRDLDELRRRHGLLEIPVAAHVAGGALAPAIMYSVALGR